MHLRFNIIPFGRKKDRINFVHLSKPTKNGFAGMIRSSLFKEDIAILIGEVDDYYNAGLGLSHNEIPVVVMMPETFYGIKRGDKSSRVTLLHELGHYINNDHITYNNPEEYNSIRENSVNEGNVVEQELMADDFAVKYLGKEYVAEGLEGIISTVEESIDTEPDFDPENDISLKELRLRINRLTNDKEG